MSQTSSSGSSSTQCCAETNSKHCGGSHHKRITSLLCPCNPNHPSYDAARASSPARSENSGQPIKGWIPVDVPNEYTLRFDTEVHSELFALRTEKHVKSLLENLKHCAEECGYKNWNNMSRYDVFDTFSNKGLRMLHGWCADRLTAAGMRQVSMPEFYAFLGVVLMYESCTTTTLNLAIKTIQSILTYDGRASPECQIMSPERYNEILSALSCLPPEKEGSVGFDWNQSVDTVAKCDAFEAQMYSQSRRICVTNNLTFVINDELVASRSNEVQSMALSQRRADKEGLESNAIADATFRFFLAVRHKKRLNHSDLDAVKEILADIGNHRSNLDVQLAAADRGHSKLDLWMLLSSLSIAYVMIADTVEHPFTTVTDVAIKVSKKIAKRGRAEANIEAGNSQARDSVQVSSQGKNGRPKKEFRTLKKGKEITKSAVELGIVSHANFIVEDHPLMGQEVFAARTTISNEKGQDIPIMAFAFVDYLGKKGSMSKVLRFVESRLPPAMSNQFVHTICMEKKPVPQESSLRTSHLFYPCTMCNNIFECTHRHESRKKAEEKILSTAIPLTCGQRCADWFVLRQFVVTGTSGAKIAKLDPNARALLQKVGEDDSTDSDHIDLTRDDDDEAGDDNNDDGNVNDADAPVDEDEGAVCDILPDDPDREELLTVDEQVARVLLKSWVFTRGLSTPAMKSGTINEANICKSLKSFPWCKAIFEVGLLQSKETPVLAASSDAIALVRRPHGHGNALEYVSCEFKTRISEKEIHAAHDVYRKHNNKYISCVVGDSVWWEAVPPLWRGQVIHQAVVTGLNCLLTIAKCDGIIYSCFIEVPETARKTYQDSIESFEHLMTWAHRSAGVRKPDEEDDNGEYHGPPPTAPLAFGEDGQRILESHLRLWRAVRKRVKAGPLPPLHAFKCMPQVVYNAIKGGIDESTQYVEVLSSPDSTLPLTKEIAIRGFKHMVMNSFLAYRFLVLARREGQNFNNGNFELESFRNKLHKVESLRHYAFQLAIDIAARSIQNKRPFENVGEVEAAEGMENCAVNVSKRPRKEDLAELLNNMPTQRQRIVKYFNDSPLLTALRFGAIHGQSNFGWTLLNGRRKYTQKICVMCGGHVATQCTTCQVPLHWKKIGSSTKSCQEKWHSMKFLQMSVQTKR